MRSMQNTALTALAIALAMPAAAAQNENDEQNAEYDLDFRPARGELFFHGSVAVPVGAFKNHVDLGGGGGAGLLVYLDENRNAALRLEGDFVVYGTESFTTPLSQTVRVVDVTVRTTNYIASAGVGPQFVLGSGPVRPYVFGTVGISYFATSSSVSGANFLSEEFASSTNLDDLKFALRGGGGMMVRLSQGKHAVSLDFSASYQHNGETEYLTKGDLRQPAAGQRVQVVPLVSDTNLMTYRMGISVGTG